MAEYILPKKANSDTNLVQGFLIPGLYLPNTSPLTSVLNQSGRIGQIEMMKKMQT